MSNFARVLHNCIKMIFSARRFNYLDARCMNLCKSRAFQQAKSCSNQPKKERVISVMKW